MNHQISGKPYLAKGSNVKRCDNCYMSLDFCICSQRKQARLNPSFPMEFWLLTHKEEQYKPTNTGRLIEQILPEVTRTFIWHRTEPDPVFLSLIKDARYQPYLIFPGDRGGYADRVVSCADQNSSKIPAFIILDGSWRQAGRMFRLSPFLQDLPVLPLKSQIQSVYKLRKAPDEYHLCTAEVAVSLLGEHHQTEAATALKAYFDVFNEEYAQSRRLKP